ncbi:nucleoside diphosphate-linked moiety X motif 17 [Aulostomus maculatus]
MDKVRRILVHVCLDRVPPQPAHFLQSITGLFSHDEDEVDVSCLLEKKHFIIYRDDKGQRIPLKRPSFCPIKNLSVTEAAAIPLDIQQRGVDVGVAVMLQTANQRVLLTRRAEQLRVFPNVWVPPGGHLEPGETLLAAGLRELREETGLNLEPEQLSPKILGLWESVFPATLSRGLPERHHLVVYMLLHSSHTHLQLQDFLNPSPAEVSACLWADAQLVKAIGSAEDGEDSEVRLKELPRSVSILQVSSDGGLRNSMLPLAVLISRAPASGPDVERVSTGTKFALNLWLKNMGTCDL